jgi:hypothetical protein
MGFGAPLSMAVFLCVGVINGGLWKRGVPVIYDEGDEERAAIYKKIKSGTVKLAKLPYPVVETAETRELEALIQKNLVDGGAPNE